MGELRALHALLSYPKPDDALIDAVIIRLLLDRGCVSSGPSALASLASSIDGRTIFLSSNDIVSALEKVFSLPQEALNGCPAQILGTLYESLLALRDGNHAATHTQLEGVYYTPSHIVKQMIELSLEKTLPSWRVLDPACGSGAFLCQALRSISEIRGPTSHSDKIKIIERELVGIDKDETALKLCRAALLIEALSGAKLSSLEDLLKPKFDLRSGDFLLDISAVKEDENFSLIIGNPPYGLSRDGRLSSQENSQLKSRFKDFLSGKPNKYLLFLAHGIELLKENSRLSFMIPNSWLGIDSGRKIREIILSQKLLSQLIVYQGDVFGDPGVEAVTVALKKDQAQKSFIVSRVDSQSLTRLDQFTLEHEQTLKTPSSTIPTVWTEKIGEIFRKLDGSCILLGGPRSLFEPRIALQAYAEGKGNPTQSRADVKNRIYDCNTKEDEHTYPYLEGREIERFRIAWGGGYLKHGEFLAEPQTIERFIGPRILVREILGKAPYLLISAYTEEPYLYNKSVLHILPKTEASRDQLLSLCGILNSKLASFFVKFRGKKSQRRLFPKLVNSDLKQFPIPQNFNPKKIAELTAGLLQCQHTDQTLEDSLNRAVYQAYQLSNSEVETIEQHLDGKNLPDRSR